MRRSWKTEPWVRLSVDSERSWAWRTGSAEEIRHCLLTTLVFLPEVFVKKSDVVLPQVTATMKVHSPTSRRLREVALSEEARSRILSGLEISLPPVFLRESLASHRRHSLLAAVANTNEFGAKARNATGLRCPSYTARGCLLFSFLRVTACPKASTVY